MHPRCLLVPIVLLLASATAAAGQPPRVLVSIQPAHALVASVMQGVAAPELMTPSTVSPHHRVLRPSDMTSLERADLVFWMGATLEPYLGRALDASVRTVNAVNLSAIDDLVRLPVRDNAIWDGGDDHGRAGARTHGDGKDAHGETDPHFWLGPMNAPIMLSAITEALIRIDPERAALYRDNASRTRASMITLDTTVRKLLDGLQDRPFVVFHDAYQYFEHHYGLAAVGALHLHDADRPSARRVQALRAAITERGVVCVFSEPQIGSRLVTTVTEGTKARVGTLDPLGAGIPPGPEAYAALITALARNVRDCLTD